ncbi:hypothetical protein SAMN05660293_02298 [Dyadobacter psychrophilus]|uniref:Uncharacterized protein n=1 Tax=Dyadobacter psychrophilus TaxID=651661 RepID=A0A1T5EBJ9_9BACT|nr:hypothetical protein SAMN05660293_02298 [Dyadobacter psychrophilus]
MKTHLGKIKICMQNGSGNPEPFCFSNYSNQEDFGKQFFEREEKIKFINGYII